MADPYRTYNFNLLIEGIAVGGFLRASGLGADIEVISYREAGAGGRMRQLPGQLRHRPLVLSYGVSRAQVLWDWFAAVGAGTVERRNVSVVQFENDGVSEAFRWNLYQAWPAQFSVSSLDSAVSEVAIESVTLVYDALERD